MPEIVISEYNPLWPEWFDEVHAYVWPAVCDLALRIDHVGSTSVPGLAGKPIIDMDIVISEESRIAALKERLAAIGYVWLGDLGIAGREAFRLASDRTLPSHHLYLVVEDNRAHQDHWLLRELLIEDANARRTYAELKRANARRAKGDLERYTEMKADLVAQLLVRARAERGLEPVAYWRPKRTEPPELT